MNSVLMGSATEVAQEWVGNLLRGQRLAFSKRVGQKRVPTLWLLTSWVSLALVIALTQTTGWAQEVAPPIPSRLERIVLETIEASNPQTPAELMRAVDSLVKIGQFEPAQRYLDQAIAKNSSRDELVRLLNELGSPFFFRLSLKAPLQPAIEEFTQEVFAAAEQAARDPAKLAAWTQQLGDESVDKRLLAVNRLRQAGPLGAAAILTELVKSDSSVDPVRLRSALLQFGPAARPVLIAALRSNNDSTLGYHALRVLGQQPGNEVVADMLSWCFAGDRAPTMQTECQRAVATRLGQVPSRDEARDYLLHKISSLLCGESLLDTDLDGMSRLWVWSDNGLEQRVYTQEMATLIRATQLAGDLFTIDSSTSEPRLLFAATQLATAKVAGSLTQPLDIDSPRVQHVRSQFSTAELENVLALALDRQLVPAAIVTAELLGQVGAQRNLGEGSTGSALAAALRYPNRRVQFAAADAIMRLDPSPSFDGASDLMRVLTRFAGSQGTRRALIISPIRSEADLIATDLTSFGFAADIATNGRQALTCLYQLADYDLILLHERTSSPKWSELVQQLRHDHRSRNIPVCLMVRSDNQWLALELAARYEKTFVFPPLTDRNSLAVLLHEMLPSRRDDQLSSRERQQYAEAALEWLAKIAGDRTRYAFLEVDQAEPAILAALDRGGSTGAIVAAGNLGTPAAQQALIAVASGASRSAADRQAALGALNTATSRHGLLLTRPQLVAQYDQYNDAVDRNDPQVEILSKILDVIELPSSVSSQ